MNFRRYLCLEKRRQKRKQKERKKERKKEGRKKEIKFTLSIKRKKEN